MPDADANLYYRLAALVESGSTMSEALTILQESESWSRRRGLERAIRTLDQGMSFTDALRAAQLFDPWEIQLLVAGEKSGHLPEVCRRLAKVRDQRAQRIQELIFRSAYPFLLVHLAIFGPSLFIYMNQGAAAYWKTVLPAVGIFYAAILFPLVFYWMSREIRPLGWLMDHILLRVPLVSSCILKYELSHSMAILHGYYASGITLRDAFAHLKHLTRNQVLQKVFYRIEQKLWKGETLAEAVQLESWLPRYVRNLLATGDVSGQLEQNLSKAIGYLEHEAETSLKALMGIVSTAIFLIAAIVVAYKIISFYSSYFQQLQNLRAF